MTRKSKRKYFGTFFEILAHKTANVFEAKKCLKHCLNTKGNYRTVDLQNYTLNLVDFNKRILQ